MPVFLYAVAISSMIGRPPIAPPYPFWLIGATLVPGG